MDMQSLNGIVEGAKIGGVFLATVGAGYGGMLVALFTVESHTKRLYELETAQHAFKAGVISTEPNYFNARRLYKSLRS